MGIQDTTYLGVMTEGGGLCVAGRSEDCRLIGLVWALSSPCKFLYQKINT